MMNVKLQCIDLMAGVAVTAFIEIVNQYDLGENSGEVEYCFEIVLQVVKIVSRLKIDGGVKINAENHAGSLARYFFLGLQVKNKTIVA